MGIYRLLLAYCVLYSHVFGAIRGWNVGVVAVISFFVMSGYVMTILLDRHYPDLADTGLFYADRAARLFPQYLLYLTLTLIAVASLGISGPFLQDFDAISVALNAALLPIGYYMFGLNHALYLSPAWSLGLEATFYLVFPFVHRLPPLPKDGVFIASIAVFLVASLGLINTDWFGYRLLPGTLFVFLCGSALTGRLTKSRFMPWLAGAVAVVTLVWTLIVRGYDLPYSKEVAAGLLISLIAVALLRRVRFSWLDELFGNLSYGLFLNHYLLMLVADRFGIDRLAVPFAALAFSALSYRFVERPALQWRRRLRAAGSAKAHGNLTSTVVAVADTTNRISP